LKDSGDSFPWETSAWNFWILAFFVFGARRVTGALGAVVFTFLALAITSFVVVSLVLLFRLSLLF
jgi:hypothetical protein